MNPTVEIFLPVFNEELTLPLSVPRVLRAAAALPYPTQVIILDNASTDGTEGVARELIARHPELAYVRFSRKGRGYALREGWRNSDADIVAYMDIDLSTDLAHLPALIDAVVSGAQLVTGSRLMKASSVYNRSFKREVLSRGYNGMLRFALASPVRDAQCGFKAMRRAAFLQLLDQIQDERWFFDTELLLAANRSNMVVTEIPVRWVDDRESTVDVGATVAEDLRGMARIWWATKPDSLLNRLATFSAIGVASTLGYALLYWLLLDPLGHQVANIFSLLVMTVANTGLNRRLTFRRRDKDQLLRHYTVGLLTLGLTWAFTAAMIAILDGIQPDAATITVTIWATTSSLLATALKYALFATMFRLPKAKTHSKTMKEQRVAA